MKKHAVLAALVTLVTAGTAQAEHSLLVTDVLEPGKAEVQAGWEYTYLKHNISSGGVTGRVKQISSEAELKAGVGVAKGLELSVALPYVFSEREILVFEGETEHVKRDGLGDLTVGAKYAISDQKEKPYGIVVGLDVKFDTARTSEAGTGTTDYSPYVAVSRKVGHAFTPYLGYRATLRNHDAADTHTVQVGVEHEIAKAVTIDFKADAAYNTSANGVDGHEIYTLDLGAYIEVCKNFYIIPSVAYIVRTGFDAGDMRMHTTNGIRPGIALYTTF